MDYFRRNFKAIAGALVGVLSVLLPAYATTGTISPQDWGLAVVALIGGHQIVYATPANKVTVETALGVVVPVLSKRSPYAAESLKAAISAVPEYVPTAVVASPPAPEALKPAPVPDAPAPVVHAGPITPPPSVDVVTAVRPPSPVPVGNTAAPAPPVSEPVGATAAPAP
jgi:hypothetical protein